MKEILNDLQQHAQDYDFFQAMKLLQRYQSQKKKPQEQRPATTRRSRKKLLTNQIRIRPDLSLDYANNDIHSLLINESGEIDLTTNFMGLYGISSPLPTFFTEELLDDQWDSFDSPRDFLDIIHQHLYPLLYKAWQKNRFAHQSIEQKKTQYWDLLFSLIGLNEPEIRKFSQNSQRFLPYLGLLSQKQRSANALSCLLKDLLDNQAISLIPCVRRQVAINQKQHAKLGLQQTTLGRNCTIGEFVDDRMSSAQIKISHVNQRLLQRFITDQPWLDLIRSVITYYLQQPLKVTLCLELAPDAIDKIQLGASNFSQLGVDTWLEYNSEQTTCITIELIQA